MLVTNEMILSELKEIKRELALIKQRDIENNINEISLDKARKLVRKSPDFLIAEYKAGRLKAMPYKDKDGNERLRFRICDLNDWQKNRSEELPEEKVYHLDPHWPEKFRDEFHKNKKKGINQ
jgi:hypothetical protein